MTVLPSRAQLTEMIGSAVRAPSVHNTQPWLFRPVADGVEVYADWRRQLLVSDPDGRAVRVSCGAAVFNLRLALRRAGFQAEVHLYGEHPLALVRVTGQAPPTPDELALFEAIPLRRTSRLPFVVSPIVPADRVALMRAAETEGAWLSLVVGQPAVELVAAMARIAEDALVGHPGYRGEVAAWSRDDGTEDGVPRSAGGPAPHPLDVLVSRNFGGQVAASTPAMEPDPFLAVLGTYVDSATADLLAGQALQRVLLTATNLGLSTSLSSQAIDVATVRERLRVGLHRYGPPQMVLRLGRADPVPATGRRRLGDVVLELGDPVPVAEDLRTATA